MIKNIKIKIFLLVLFVIFATSLISSLLLFFYMDVDSNMKVGFTTMGIASFLLLSSSFSLLIYFFKKIYYRGEIYLSNLNSSLRQGIFLAIFIMGMILFYATKVFNYKTSLLLLVMLIFIELIFQSMKD